MSALAELNNLITCFNRPPGPTPYLSLQLNWVYQCRHVTGLVTELEPLDHPVNASINLSGSATLALTPEKPEDRAVVAIAGERGAVWLGLVECTS